MAFQLRDSEQLPVAIEALDSENNPADVTTRYATSDDQIVGVNDALDGSATLIASPGAGGLGTATITATITNNADGTSIEASLDIEVVAGDAVVANIVPGTAQPKG